MGVFKPKRRKLIAAVVEILAFKDSHVQHFDGRQFRFEIRRKIFTRRFNQMILIIMLHLVVDKNNKIGQRRPVPGPQIKFMPHQIFLLIVSNI